MGFRLVVRSLWSPESISEFVYEFDQERVVIGRGKGADVCIPHQAVSGQHATIRSKGAGYVVQDDGSTNGTRVGSASLAPARPRALRNGDVIELGGFAIRFEGGRSVTLPTSVDRTAALARRILREALEAGGSSAQQPRLLVLNGPEEGQELIIPEPPTLLVVGRGPECDLRLSDADASREHAELERDLDGVLIRDLGSKNGLLINGRPARQRRLHDRDEIRIGATVIVLEDPDEAAVEETAAAPEREMALPEPVAASPPSSEAVAAGETVGDDAPAHRTDDDAREAAGSLARAGGRRSGAGADIFIYLLAAAVLAVSILGLVILLRAE